MALLITPVPFVLAFARDSAAVLRFRRVELDGLLAFRPERFRACETVLALGDFFEVLRVDRF